MNHVRLHGRFPGHWPCGPDGDGADTKDTLSSAQLSHFQQLKNQSLFLCAPVASRYSCASYPSLARLIGGGMAAGLLPRIAEQEFRNIPTRRIDLPHNSPVHETLWLIWNPRMIELAPRREKAIATIGKIIRDQLRG